MRTCYFCRGIVEEVEVDYMAQRNGGYTLIRALPVERCRQCGEVYLSADSSQIVDDVLSRQTVPDDHLIVPVVTCG